MNYPFESLKAEYAHMWAHMDIDASRVSVAQSKAQKIINGKNRYQILEAKTNVPWYFIGLLHLRESDCDFNTHLHNGDPLSKRTYHVPAGRPLKGSAPFSFEFSAIDALEQKSYHKITDWSIERIAYCLEKYNGFGYRSRGFPSAYLWASTDQYKSGKFIFDGPKGWRPNVVDKQLGAMAVLKCIMDMEQIAPETSAPVINDETPNTPTADVERPTNTQMAATSKKWNATSWLYWLLGIPPAAQGVNTIVDTADIQSVKTYTQTIKELATAFGPQGIFILSIIAIGVVMYIRKRMKDDVQEGRAEPSGIQK